MPCPTLAGTVPSLGKIDSTSMLAVLHTAQHAESRRFAVALAKMLSAGDRLEVFDAVVCPVAVPVVNMESVWYRSMSGRPDSSVQVLPATAFDVAAEVLSAQVVSIPLELLAGRADSFDFH